MGRRKERRLAAISAAGRRVKLDLFAEPSGDLGDSSAQEGVGGDGDSRSRTELPSSPSSSGQQPQNPLLLLEQYSDEELGDGSTGGQNHAVSQSTSISIDKEAIDAASENTEDTENNNGKEHNEAVEQVLMNNGSASLDPSKRHEEISILGVNSDHLPQQQTNKMGETASTSAPDDCLIGDASSGWKMVLHEESNQYYYWNTVTGETSWEVPAVFVQESITSVERADGCTRGTNDDNLEMEKVDTPRDMGEDDMTTRNVGVESKVSGENCEGAFQGTEADGCHKGFKGDDAIDGEEARNDANRNDGNSLLGTHSVENRSGTEFPSQLIQQCEGLLERLNSVKGRNCYTEDKDLKLKCMLEIEVRLADMKALVSNGSSLITFWMHSESQLKRLEAAVDDAIKSCCSVSPSTLEEEVDSCVRRDFSVAEPHAVPISKSSNFEAYDAATSTEHLTSLYYPSTYTANDVGGKSEIAVTEKDSVSPPRPTLQAGEDVDMDVDMEVEDTSTVRSPHGGLSGCHYPHVTPEPSSLHNNQAEQEASVPGNVFSAPPVEEWIPPPPPDSEPFPPPPPDDEPFPPPPPDEPPETSYPSSSHFGSVQPFTYPEQYTTSYPRTVLEYYGQTNLEGPASTLYTHPDGGQVAVSHLPHYYEAVPNLYGVTPLVVNPVDAAAYYGPQSASLSHVPLISGDAEASIAQGETVPENVDSAEQGPLDSLPQDGSSFLAKSSVNAGEFGHGTVKASAEIPNAQPVIGAPSTSSMANGVSVSSTSDATSVSAAAAAAAAAASKAQSKVSRSKKRTVAVVSSLRSNKKVSTMVDKWKAAKEELQEDEKEEEPENAYESLEKKRQREIEEWRAQQIASGESKDNANFQPLGGDWRERVKRRRAERMKEKKQITADVAASGGNQQQADVVELSRGLPSGWQAYWDESSKQVYYGNVLTSETTWTRPPTPVD